MVTGGVSSSYGEEQEVTRVSQKGRGQMLSSAVVSQGPLNLFLI